MPHATFATTAPATDLLIPPTELIHRYDTAGPRYTSYPTVPAWRTDFGPAAYAERLRAAGADRAAPLSTYVHLPFCQEMCTYCGCNVVITKDRKKVDRYLDHLIAEMEVVGALLGERRDLGQLHWGGGTPTFLDEGQLERLFSAMTARFPLLQGAEVAIEIDPVVTTVGQLRLLRRLGFNRLSMGVQDFDEQVQHAVHRIQSPEDTQAVLQCARELGFSAVNFDLIYGLPHQTPSSWQATLERVVAMRPDRLAVYSFAYVPDLRPHQRRLPINGLPTGPDKLALFLLTYRVLLGAGYRPIGMDHFALPEDELALAQERRLLWRNFQGYTVKPPGDVVAFGVTGISDVNGCYAQNTRPLGRYAEAVTGGVLATERGMVLSEDDQRRRAVITRLMCNFWVELGAEVNLYADELERLLPFARDGLVRIDGSRIEVLPLGRLFVRNIAMVFDAHLPRTTERSAFSRTV